MYQNNQYKGQPPQLPLRNQMATPGPMLQQFNLPLSTLLAPPPPPPPPTTTQTHTTPHTTYTAPPTANMHPVYSTPTQVALPEMFDASRPPPPITQHPLNGSLKRRAAESAEARCKVWKRDCAEDDAPCAACLKREIRIAELQQQANKLQRETERRNSILKKKKEHFDNVKLLLKSSVSPRVFQAMDEHIEENPNEAQDVLSQLELILSRKNRRESLHESNIMDEPELWQALSVAMRKKKLVNNRIPTELIRSVLELNGNSSSISDINEAYLSDMSSLPSTSKGSPGLASVLSNLRESIVPNVTVPAAQPQPTAGPSYVAAQSFVPPVFSTPPPLVTTPYAPYSVPYAPGSFRQSGPPPRRNFPPYSKPMRFSNRYFPPHQ